MSRSFENYLDIARNRPDWIESRILDRLSDEIPANAFAHIVRIFIASEPVLSVETTLRVLDVPDAKVVETFSNPSFMSEMISTLYPIVAERWDEYIADTRRSVA